MKKFAAAFALAVIAGAASASTISYQTGTSFESGLADANAYRTAVSSAVAGTAVTSISSYDSLDLSSLRNFALASTITFYVTSPESFDFRAGVDFGGGGALFLDGNALNFKSTNMWWAGSYSDSSQFLASAAPTTLSVGAHTVNLYGIEDCCSGNSQVQFSLDAGTTYTSFSTSDGLPAVPEAQSFAMLLAGLSLVATAARRRSNKQA